MHEADTPNGLTYPFAGHVDKSRRVPIRTKMLGVLVSVQPCESETF